MRICLNMIVRNERANIRRCLESVSPFISSWVICDTGSTDNTQEIVLQFMRERGIPGELHEFEFQNFSQARNTALKLTWSQDYDYVLLMDADMELVVDQPGDPFAHLEAPYYRMLQRGGGLCYANTRLVRRGHRAEYIGVTHEYLNTDVEPEALIYAHFLDHMDGGSRGDKYQRDEKLLLADMERDPTNARTVYYFAQTQKDLGKPGVAAHYYEQRAKMGGWDEEAWHSQLMAARCWGAEDSSDPDYIAGLLKAYAMRPTRAEPLLSLAIYYRLKGNNELAVMFARQGMDISYPDKDILFVEPEAYHDGFLQELSIAGFYAGDREEAYEACETLATKLDAYAGHRQQARWNLQFYAEPLAKVAPSFNPVRIATLTGAMNPSVVCTESRRLLTTIRHVNYTISHDGSYVMNDGDTAIKTQNFLCELDPVTLERKAASPIHPPYDYPNPAYHEVLGFEDIRLFTTDDPFLHFIATVRDINGSGIATPIVGVIQPCVEEHETTYHMTDWCIMQRTFNAGHEKNWMPVNARHGDGIFADAPYNVGGGRFVYSCGPQTIVLDDTAAVVREQKAYVACENWRGSSQLIQWGDGWLAVVHEVDAMPGAGERSYQHRFVYFTPDFKVKSWSGRFYLQRRGIEFVCGLCWHPNRDEVVISWGANRDSEAWVARISADDVDSLLMYN
jgi:glycosyltransferase involved in cell wall biosynthesis